MRVRKMNQVDVKLHDLTIHEQQRKLCHTTFLPTALPVGVSRLMPSSGGISPLTCTIFDPNSGIIG